MKVSDLQHHELFTAQADESLDEAADRMNWHQVGALPVLGAVLGGSGAWDANPTLRRAIEIRDGVIQNPASCPSRAVHRSTRTGRWRPSS
jgi:CBS-domain-containing membrane protein